MNFTKTLFSLFAIFIIIFNAPNTAMSKDMSINDIQKFFDNLKSIESDFTQIDTSGINRNGKFYLSNPKKIRLDYFSQDQEQIYLSGSQFIYYNPILDEVSYIPSSRVPISFLSTKIKLGDDIKILDFNQDDLSMNIKLEVPLKKSELININLNFLKRPLILNTITFNDLISGKTIILKLNNPLINKGIPKKIFDFDDPHF